MLRTVRPAALLGVALLLALLPRAASAHEERELLGGQYSMVIGFIEEPAFVGEKNGLSLYVAKPNASPAAGAEAGEANQDESGVLGLADTLQAEVIFGEETMPLELRPSFNEPGAYLGYFFPMAEGDYTFRVFGDLEGNAIDERFTSSPDGFDGVQPREPLEFPKSAAAASGASAATIGGVDAGSAGQTGAFMAVALAAAGALGFGLLQRRRTAMPLAPALAGD